MHTKLTPSTITPNDNRYTHLGRYMSVLILTILLSACGSYSTKKGSDFALDKDAYLNIPDTWTIHAKLGIKSGEDSGSVTLNWQQEDGRYDIQLRGPLGQGNAKLSGSSQKIRIEQPGKETLYSSKPKALVQQTFGWDLPIQHLPYWIRGVQSPYSETHKALNNTHSIASIQYNAAGLLSTLSQFGWALEYSRYKPQQQRLAPHKIRANRNGVTLTLIIKQWDFPNIIATTTNTIIQ
jgi:outer membrane lipoprotein LolB